MPATAARMIVERMAKIASLEAGIELSEAKTDEMMKLVMPEGWSVRVMSEIIEKEAGMSKGLYLDSDAPA